MRATLFIILIVLSITLTSAYINNESKVHGTIEDIYIFDSKGNFERISVIFLAHDNQNNRMDLVFSQPFPNYKEENHNILSNISYSFYWENYLNDSIIVTPEADFKKGETITEIKSLGYGELAHIERKYNASIFPNYVNLQLNIEKVDNINCIEIECGIYDYQYFKRVIKIQKGSYFFKIIPTELNVNGLTSYPDKIYDEGKYRVYVWESVSFDIGNLKIQNIKFSYEYKIPSWFFWSMVFAVLGIIVTVIYYYKQNFKKYFCLKCNKNHIQSKTIFGKHLNFKN